MERSHHNSPRYLLFSYTQGAKFTTTIKVGINAEWKPIHIIAEKKDIVQFMVPTS